MKKLSIVLIITVAWLGAFAQNKEAMDKIESARIALITERLGLTPDQAEKFWPLYREYNQQRRLLREEFRNARQSVDRDALTEEQSKELMKKALEMKQRELNLENEYSQKMTQYISAQQMLQLRGAEHDFQQMVLKRIQNQRQMQDQNEKMKQNREMMRERNNN
ncbi:MAG: hypothetical protein U5K79_00270 [Cyclobacteriaceae bacterium]|nr:hypothetical protein [Cyclobacteriaceae bacterium]